MIRPCTEQAATCGERKEQLILPHLLSALLLLLLLLRPRERLEDLEEDLPDPEELREGEEEPLLGIFVLCATQRKSSHTRHSQEVGILPSALYASFPSSSPSLKNSSLTLLLKRSNSSVNCVHSKLSQCVMISL
jgi:hypothetical protein